tara:strand:+ start:3921 stop:4142 length:222 start_codon:yes stop_codon:yes gene_type:complete
MSNRNNEGAIWGNKRKEKETHADFTGNATIDGVEYWINAYKRKPDASPNAPSLKFYFVKKEVPDDEPAPEDDS